jgi:cytochrome b subunit of formate dehydrogenase
MRTVTSSRNGAANHWHVMMAYLLVGYSGLAYAAYAAVNGDALQAGSVLSLVVAVLAIGGVWTMTKLFRDAMQLRRQSAGWRPSWVRYIAGALGVPIVVFVAGDQLGVSEAGFFAFYAYILGVVAANTVYLWRRHKFLDRP